MFSSSVRRPFIGPSVFHLKMYLELLLSKIVPNASQCRDFYAPLQYNARSYDPQKMMGDRQKAVPFGVGRFGFPCPLFIIFRILGPPWVHLTTQTLEILEQIPLNPKNLRKMTPNLYLKGPADCAWRLNNQQIINK